MNDPMHIEKPLVLMFEDGEGLVVTHLYPSEKCESYEGYGLLIYDLVRHVANKFKVHEDQVWEWVVKERHHHTTDIRNPS